MKILEEELDVLTRLGYPAEFASTPTLPFPTVGGVQFPNQGQFHPLKFLSAIAQDLTIYENTPVLSLKKDSAVTDRG